MTQCVIKHFLAKERKSKERGRNQVVVVVRRRASPRFSGFASDQNKEFLLVIFAIKQISNTPVTFLN